MNKTVDTITDAASAEPGAGVGGEGFATILQVLPALGKGGGGVERGVVEVAAAITAAGGRALVASSGGDMVVELKRARAEHFTLPVDSKNPLVIRANINRLVKLIKSEGVDIVHARSRAPAWSAYYAAKRAGVHFVTTFHGTYSHGNWLKRRYNAIMIRGERVIAISNYIAVHIRRLYGTQASIIRTIHRGVNLKYFNPGTVGADRVAQLAEKWRISDGSLVIMLPGRLTRWKGQTVFIKAIAKLNRRDIRCILVGSDQGRFAYKQELEDLVKEHDLGEVMRIVGTCNDMPAAYMLTDVVVSASTDPEAFGRVAAEGQALGCPVIATNHGGALETIIEGETGWLTPPGDVDALAQAMEKVLALKEEDRRSLAEKAIANVRANFSKETMCARTLDVYREVLNS